MKSYQPIIMAFVLSLFANHLTGQDLGANVFSSSSSSLNSTSNTLIWTVGEAVVSTLEGPNVKLYMGFIMPITVGSATPQVSSKSNSDLVVGNPVFSEAKEVLLYPNPLDQGERLLIRGEPLTSQSVNIKVITSNGQVLSGGQVNAQIDDDLTQMTLELNMPPGFYLLQIPVKSGFVTRKLVIR